MPSVQPGGGGRGRETHGTQAIDVAGRLAIGALVGALGGVGTSAAQPVPADATAVNHWNEVAVNTLAAIPGPNGGAPPALQINMGMVQGAVYDAVNAIEPSSTSHICSRRPSRAKASKEAAVATAAYTV